MSPMDASCKFYERTFILDISAHRTRACQPHLSAHTLLSIIGSLDSYCRGARWVVECQEPERDCEKPPQSHPLTGKQEQSRSLRSSALGSQVWARQQLHGWPYIPTPYPLIGRIRTLAEQPRDPSGDSRGLSYFLDTVPDKNH